MIHERHNAQNSFLNELIITHLKQENSGPEWFLEYIICMLKEASEQRHEGNGTPEEEASAFCFRKVVDLVDEFNKAQKQTINFKDMRNQMRLTEEEVVQFHKEKNIGLEYKKAYKNGERPKHPFSLGCFQLEETLCVRLKLQRREARWLIEREMKK